MYRWIYLMILLPLLGWSQPEYGKLIGTAAPEWTLTDWYHSPPLQLKDLRGKVVLVRWWTGPECPLCRATVPALEEWHRKYKDRGLVVIGVYHHKSPRPLEVEQVHRMADEMGISFPIAIDREWKTLRRWWLDKVPQADYTSVTFLIDGEGNIHDIHPGGKYIEGDGSHRRLDRKIRQLLRENASK